MSILRAPDDALDAVVIHWRPGPDRFLTRASLPEGMAEPYAVLRHFFALLDWDEALLLAEGVARQQAVGMDMRSIAYPSSYEDDTPEDERPAPGEVLLRDGGGGQVIASAVAFDRLIARLLQTMIAGAERESLPETEAEWWPRFVELSRQIAERAAGAAPRPA